MESINEAADYSLHSVGGVAPTADDDAAILMQIVSDHDKTRTALTDIRRWEDHRLVTALEALSAGTAAAKGRGSQSDGGGEYPAAKVYMLGILGWAIIWVIIPV